MAADEGIPTTRETRSRTDHHTGKRVFIRDASFWQTHAEERAPLGQSVHGYCTQRGCGAEQISSLAQRLERREKAPAHTRGEAKVGVSRSAY